MKNNLIIKLICSLPVILLITYFIPFLGIILVLFRFFVYNKKHYVTAITLVTCGLLILLPKIVNYVSTLIKANIEVPYLDKIITSDIYTKLLSYSKLLVIVGVILMLLSYIGNMLATKIGSSLGNYFNEAQRKEYEISEKNDLIMKEKQVKAKNTHFVKCPNCGGDNTIIGNVGKCKFCRRDIEYKG